MSEQVDDVLAHYGVLGMKWGKTRVRATGPQIRSARRSVQKSAIKVADAKSAVKAAPKGSAKRAKAETNLAKTKVDFLKNPDRVTAARLTRGEKAVVALFLTPAGAAGAIAGTSAVSRRIEFQQDTKAFNKKP